MDMIKSIRPQIEQMTKKVVEGLGYELVEVVISADKKPVLSVYVYKTGGVTANDCNKVSRRLSDELDLEDMIKEEYFLVVSSPGLERPLRTIRDFERNIGEEIKFKLDDNKEEVGTLLSLTKNDTETYLSIEKKNNIFVDMKFSNVKKGIIQVKL